MKDSQPAADEVRGAGKYIKADNERFSTAVSAGASAK